MQRLSKKLRNLPFIKRWIDQLPRTPLQEKVDVYRYVLTVTYLYYTSFLNVSSIIITLGRNFLNLRTALVLKCYEVCKSSPINEPSEEDVDKFTREVDSASHEKLITYARTELNKQLLDMYTSIDRFECEADVLKTNSANRIRKDKEKDVLMNDLKYTVYTKKSCIPNAGDGAFISTTVTIPPGTIVCLYPGLVHLREHLRDDDYLSMLLPDPDFMLMTRLDECLIDGRAIDTVPYNPYSVGHKVNHCGEDRKPNVMQVSFDYSDDILPSIGKGARFPSHLCRYIPNQFATPPSRMGKIALGIGTIMPGVVFVSTRHLRDGDELLLDYRLNPDSSTPLPPWYTPYDTAESRTRWAP
jgi:hypothetical protein